MTNSVAIGLALMGLLSALNVLFSLAFARRLKRVEERGMLSTAGRSHLLPEVGLEIGEFTTATIDATSISDQDFHADNSVIALFISSTCPACDRLRRDLLSRPLDEPTVVFVKGETSEEIDFEALSGVSTVPSQVIWLGDDLAPGLAFGVQAYPTLVRAVRGIVVSSALSLRDLGSRPRKAQTTATAA